MRLRFKQLNIGLIVLFLYKGSHSSSYFQEASVYKSFLNSPDTAILTMPAHEADNNIDTTIIPAIPHPIKRRIFACVYAGCGDGLFWQFGGICRLSLCRASVCSALVA